MNVLDSVLNPPPGRHIRDIELVNPFNAKEALDDKLSILDIKARDETGRQFNIEMQMLAFPHYAKRILYYACKLHQQQLHEGQDYLELKPTVSISFLNHVWFPQLPDYHLCFRLLERTHHFALTDDLEFHILELPKFTKSAGALTSGLDIWLYFLRHAEMMDTEVVYGHITRIPGICGGRPCIRGMRIRVIDILDLYAAGLNASMCPRASMTTMPSTADSTIDRQRASLVLTRSSSRSRSSSGSRSSDIARPV